MQTAGQNWARSRRTGLITLCWTHSYNVRLIHTKYNLFKTRDSPRMTGRLISYYQQNVQSAQSNQCHLINKFFALHNVIHWLLSHFARNAVRIMMALRSGKSTDFGTRRDDESYTLFTFFEKVALEIASTDGTWTNHTGDVFPQLEGVIIHE